jgi:hypothetical protein
MTREKATARCQRRSSESSISASVQDLVCGISDRRCDCWKTVAKCLASSSSSSSRFGSAVLALGPALWSPYLSQSYIFFINFIYKQMARAGIGELRLSEPDGILISLPRTLAAAKASSPGKGSRVLFHQRTAQKRPLCCVKSFELIWISTGLVDLCPRTGLLFLVSLDSVSIRIISLALSPSSSRPLSSLFGSVAIGSLGPFPQSSLCSLPSQLFIWKTILCLELSPLLWVT